MQRIGSALALLVLCLWPASSWAELIAELDRTHANLGDSLTLTLRATDKEDFRSIDLSQLQPDFVIDSSRHNTNFSRINGKNELVTELVLTLFARREGALQIPALHLDGSISNAITVQINTPKNIGQAGENIFVEVEVDSDSVYVQAQLIFSFRVYRSVQVDDLRLTPLDLPGVVIEELGNHNFQRSINGKTYLVTELKYALFPQKSGVLRIPALSFNGRRRSTQLSTSRISLRTEALSVQVKPIPAGYPDAAWLPAANIGIEDNWSVPTRELKLGDSVTRTITMTALGITGNQLPSIDLTPHNGLKVYQDQARSENFTDESGVTGLGISSAALLFVSAGDFQLQAVRIPWWDTTTDQLRYAVLPAQHLSIVPAAIDGNSAISGQGRSAPAAPEVNATTAKPVALVWFWTTVLGAMGWAATGILYWRRRPRKTPTVSPQSSNEKQLFAKLQAVAADTDNRALRFALVEWGQVRFDSPRRLLLADICSAIADPSVAEQIAMLEQSRFAASASPYDAKKLLAELQRWRKQNDRAGSAANRQALPPLYG